MTDDNTKVSLLDYPQDKCSCGSTTWWFSGIEPGYKGPPTWNCGKCHPPPTRVGELKMRIIHANYVLSKARLEIFKMPEEQEREAFRKWGEAVNRASALNKELKLLSTDCLYIVNGKKIKKCFPPQSEIECFGCPNDYWMEQEIFDTDKKNHPEEYE
jgi:hypothetical protein